MSSADIDAKKILEIASSNLKIWKEGGVVKTLKVYAGPDNEYGHTCIECKKHDGVVVDVGKAMIGVNVPPFSKCESIKTGGRCRCFFRPWTFYPIH